MCLPDRWWGLFGEPVYDETKKKSGLNKLDVGGGGLKKKNQMFSLIPNQINHIFNVKYKFGMFRKYMYELSKQMINLNFR